MRFKFQFALRFLVSIPLGEYGCMWGVILLKVSMSEDYL